LRFSCINVIIFDVVVLNVDKNNSLDNRNLFPTRGFSESSVIQDGIKRAFSDKQIIIPPESGIVVLKGAVIYGHKPDIIASRVVKYTYGISSTETYDPSMHDKSKRVTIDGVLRCEKIFRKLITANTSVVVGEKRYHHFHTTDRDQDFANFRLFCSSSENPKYVDETGCKEHGKFRVEIQKHSPDIVHIEVTFQFGLLF
jgi:molecular chaperone DnaK (HSP70)